MKTYTTDELEALIPDPVDTDELESLVDAIPSDKPKPVMGFGDKMWEIATTHPEEYIPFLGGVFSSAQVANAEYALNALRTGKKSVAQPMPYPGISGSVRELPITPEDTIRYVNILGDYLDKVIEKLEREETIPAQALGVVAQMIPYMTEFLMTNPLAKVVSGPTKRIVMKALAKLGPQGSVKAVKKYGLESALGVVAGEVGRLPAFSGEILKASEGGPLQGDLPATDYLKRIGSQYFENLSEMSGPALTALFNRIPGLNVLLQSLGRLWSETGKGRSTAKFWKRIFERGGYHGILEEIGEERLAGFLQGATGVEDFGLPPDENTFFNRLYHGAVPSPEQLAVEGMAFSVPFAAQTGLAAAADITSDQLFTRGVRGTIQEYGQAFDQVMQEYMDPMAIQAQKPGVGRTLQIDVTPQTVMNRIWDKEYLLTPEGAKFLNQIKPKSIQIIAQKASPSRKDFRDAGIPGSWASREREQLAENLRNTLGIKLAKGETKEEESHVPTETEEEGKGDEGDETPGTDEEVTSSPEVAAEDQVRLMRMLKARIQQRLHSDPDGESPLLLEEELFQLADVQYGGTRAEGKYGPSDAYDAMEAALHSILSQEFGIGNEEIGADRAKEIADKIEKIVKRMPVQKNRSGQKNELQQFSTPPHYAFAAAWAAALRKGDVVLEPSAGTGSLMGMAKALKGEDITLLGNEIGESRLALLREFMGKDLTNVDAEFIHLLLPDYLSRTQQPRPSVVLMNPPFSRAPRAGEKKISGMDRNHVTSALKLMQEGGRLVAIMGAPVMGTETKGFREWLQKIGQEYTIRANITVGRDIYKHYGTTYPTRLLVIDKIKPSQGEAAEPISRWVANVQELIVALEEVRNARISERVPSREQLESESGSETASSETEGDTQPPENVPTPTGDVGTGGDQPGERPGQGIGEMAPPGESTRETVGDTGSGEGTGTGRESGGSRPEPDGGTGSSESAGGDVRLTKPLNPQNPFGDFTLDELSDIFDEVVGEKSSPAPPVESTPAPKTTPVPPTGKTSAPKTTSAPPIEGKSDLERAMDELGEIFKGAIPQQITAFPLERANEATGVRVFTTQKQEEGGKSQTINTAGFYDPTNLSHNRRLWGALSETLGLGDIETVEQFTEHMRRLSRESGKRDYAFEQIDGPVIFDAVREAGFRGIIVRSTDHATLVVFEGETESIQHGALPPELDPEKYAKAKPVFQKALDAVMAEGGDVKAFIKMVVDRFGGKGVKPYLMQFMQEKKEEESRTPPKVNIKEEHTYLPYDPPKIFENAKIHQGSIVETAAMASVDMPPLTYKPDLPNNLIESGALSDVQLVAIAYAGQAHNTFINMMGKKMRRGFMIGDGTGLGKTREILGIILDNWNQGRKLHVVISASDGLEGQLKKDWNVVGQSISSEPENMVINLKKITPTQMKNKTYPKEGIIFLNYPTLQGGQQVSNSNSSKPARGINRLEQLKTILGPDFDGVIVFDEAHRMKSTMPSAGKRGKKKASKTGEVCQALRDAFPGARVVYSSATAATEVENYAYAERLGLWGLGTSFSSREDFVSSIKQGGLQAMEILSRDLKALGLMVSRRISMNDGTPEGTVVYDRIRHKLSKGQRQVYDDLAKAWQMIRDEFIKAIQETNADARAKSQAFSQYWSTQQRFFNQIITSMQIPSLLEDMEDQLASGKSVVIQLVNTYFAQQERAYAAIKDEGAELDDIDVTPIGDLINMVRDYYPTVQYIDEYDDEGNVMKVPLIKGPKLDKDGNPVLKPDGTPVIEFVENPEMVRKRDALIERLKKMGAPETPMDMIISHFGHDAVGEVTSRGWRIVTDPETGRKVKQNRNDASKLADAKAFMDGDLRILIFSEAGGTGFDFHSDKRAKNQQQRVHYILQPGWKAEAALQGLGRTHRTFQAWAPIVKLVETDVPGQRRFIASIARRLSQLGALSAGQREAGSTGVFTEADNLESADARAALDIFFKTVLEGGVPGMTAEEFEEWTGLSLMAVDRSGALKDFPEMEQFLNRILSLTLDQQELVFGTFERIWNEQVEVARAQGTLDTGMEVYNKADRLRKGSEQIVYTHEETGATTKYIQLLADKKVEPVEFGKALSGFKNTFFLVNQASGYIWEATEGPKKSLKDGSMVDTYRMVNVEGHLQFVPRAEIDTDIRDKNWKKISSREEARQLWQKAIAELPEYRSRTLHIISGVMLPVWKKIKSYEKVYRFPMEDGTSFLGRIIRPGDINKVLAALGADKQAIKVEPEQLIQGLLDGSIASVTFSNDWKFQRRKVAGENRIEVTGVRRMDKREFDLYGGFMETVAFSDRFFIPAGPDGAKFFTQMMDQGKHNIVDIVYLEEEAEQGGILNGVLPAGLPRGGTNLSTAPWSTSPAESPGGATLLARLERDANSGRPARVGLQSIGEYLFNMVDALLIVGKTQTTKKHPGHYLPGHHIVRSKSRAWQMNLHEAGHALSYWLRDKNPQFFTQFSQELVALTQMAGSHASSNSAEEGFAELVRRFVTDHNSLPMHVVDTFVQALKDNGQEEILNGLRDAHRAYAFHLSRPFLEQMQALRNDKPRPRGILSAVKELVYEGLYNLVGGSPLVHRLRRKFWKELTREAPGNWKAKVAFAREIMSQIEDTKADFEAAYNSLLHIPTEVSRLMGGARKGREGIRLLALGDGFLGVLTPEDVEYLQDNGFDIPDEAQDPGHGHWIYLSDKSFARIKHEVGFDQWEAFQEYAQYKAAMNRYWWYGQIYPGRYDGLTPRELQDWISEVEQAKPEWEARFNDLHKFMDQLLLAAVLSGEVSPKQAVKIRGRWKHYVPLQRQVEDREPLAYASNTDPSAGLYRAFGSELPFVDLEEAIEYRVRRALEAYYNSRFMRSILAFSKELGMKQGKRVPFHVRSEALRLMLPLRLEPKKVATLNELEIKKIIADYLNEHLPPGETPVKPDDIDIATPSRPVWRMKKPNAVRIIRLFSGGQPYYYQVPDPLLFELFSRGRDPRRYLAWLAKFIGRPVQPWKRYLTQNLVFALGNFLARDSIQAIAMGRSKRHLIPFYGAAVAVVNRIKGTTPDAISTSELLSKSLDYTTRDAHQGIVDSFKEMLKEGIIIPGWADMSLGERIAELPGIAMSSAGKVIDIINWITFGRWMANLSEQVTREGAYLEATRQGFSPERAQLNYDEITGKFGQRQGNSTLASFIHVAGFLNPAIQILWGHLERITDPDPQVRRFMLGVKLPVIAGYGAIGAALNMLLIQAILKFLYGDDDEAKEEFLNNMRERRDEDRFSFMAIGGLIRLPFDYGFLGGIFSFGWNAVEEYLLNGKVDIEKGALAMLKRSAAAMPGMTEFMQPHIKTAMELYLNHSFFFDEDIVPGWLEIAFPYNPELQTYTTTPEIYNKIGRGLRVSPLKVRYAVRGLFSWQADSLLAADFGKPSGYPIIGKVFQRESIGHLSQSVREMYEAEQKYIQLKNRLKNITDPDEKAEAEAELATLAVTHDVVGELDRIWEKIREEKKRETPNQETVRNLEKRMVSVARTYLRWREKGEGMDKLAGVLSDDFWKQQAWRLSDDIPKDLNDPEERRNSINRSQYVLSQLNLPEEQLIELLRQEYSERYDRKTPVRMYTNGKINAFGERVVRLKQRLREAKLAKTRGF
ncbi:MAG TPA: strawberry notch family protein [bacterium]|nr:strawberry notch family protein [bacterium]